jgi:hypothetical protein
MKPFGAPVEQAEIIPATQIDRDSALAAARTWAQWLPEQIRTVEEGRGDYCALVQFAARHRLAVLAAQGIVTEGQDAQRLGERSE